jgi:hypothetical protein
MGSSRARSRQENPEVGVCGDQNALMITREREDQLIRRSLQALIADVLSVVPRLLEQH